MNLSMSLSRQEKLELKKLVENADCENNTDTIRRLKHSEKILTDLITVEKLKKEIPEDDKDQLLVACQEKAPFLFENYPDILSRQIKNELNMLIMTKFIRILKMIEDNEIDQHEGSALVGKVLKELYIDSAVRRGENLDNQHQTETPAKVEGKSLSWTEWKGCARK